MKEIPNSLVSLRRKTRNLSFHESLEKYFKNNEKLEIAIKNGDKKKAIKYARENFVYLEYVIIWNTLMDLFIGGKYYRAATKNFKFKSSSELDDIIFKLLLKDYPNLNANSNLEKKNPLDITEIPCIDKFGTFCAIMGLKENIDEIKEIVDYYSDLENWKPIIEEKYYEYELTLRIKSYIENNPGTIQANLKNKLNEKNGNKISTICYYLAKYGILKREKAGRSYSLYIKS